MIEFNLEKDSFYEIKTVNDVVEGDKSFLEYACQVLRKEMDLQLDINAIRINTFLLRYAKTCMNEEEFSYLVDRIDIMDKITIEEQNEIKFILDNNGFEILTHTDLASNITEMQLRIRDEFIDSIFWCDPVYAGYCPNSERVKYKFYADLDRLYNEAKSAFDAVMGVM